eukprot:m.123545 g.123545  ORF g.123545 m.123545 type:complete len:120 (-) comp13465_c0_seq2:151-510(-)
MGKIFCEFLAGSIYSCAECSTHITRHDELVSKSFQGRFGKAYLFKDTVNLETGPEKVRVLLTGEHTIADVHCIKCHAYLGWKYLNAQDQENEYKIGKTILETAATVLSVNETPTKTGWL